MKKMLLLLAVIPAVGQAGSFDLWGSARDFRMRGTDGGHPDFEWTLSGYTTGMVKPDLNVSTKRPEFAGAPGYGGVTDASTFDQWYQDVTDVNINLPVKLTFTDSGVPGVYSYSNGSFFPIDDLGYGNQGQAHNYAFTFAINAGFVYKPGQTFHFTGDDDVWVFINNKLVVDLGGVHGALTGEVDLDTLGLTSGKSYSLDVFFAERHTTASSFAMETNFEIVPEPSTLVAMGLGSLILARRVKRR